MNIEVNNIERYFLFAKSVGYIQYFLVGKITPATLLEAEAP